jgi:hypothetical protein
MTRKRRKVKAKKKNKKHLIFLKCKKQTGSKYEFKIKNKVKIHLRQCV